MWFGRGETPSPTQPVKTAIAPLTAAEGKDSTPEQKQLTQSATAPQTGELSGMALLKMRLKKWMMKKRKGNQKIKMTVWIGFPDGRGSQPTGILKGGLKNGEKSG